MKGWHKDNWRHSLAARGLTKGYFARKGGQRYAPVDYKKSAGDISSVQQLLEGPISPTTARARLTAAAGVEQAVESMQRAGRPVNLAIENVYAGDYSQALNFIEDPRGNKISDTDVEALKSALNARALSLTTAGLPVPESIQKHLSKEMKTRLATVQESVKRAEETPFRKTLREQLAKGEVAAVAGALEAPGEGIAAGGAEWQRLGEGGKQWTGLSGQIDAVKGSPMLKDNTAITNPADDGLLNPLSFVEGGVPNLGSSWSFLGPTPNLALAKTPTQAIAAAKKVQEQVDSLYEDREKLAKVDFGIYEEGDRAFKEGNREKLQQAVSEMEAEENKLKDRWTLIGQAHRELLSMQNYMSSFAKDSDNPALELNKVGASRLADQTEKLARTRAEVLKSMNGAYTRRVLLQNRLKRLNSNVPAESGAPENVQKLLPPEKSFVASVKNPLLEEGRYVG